MKLGVLFSGGKDSTAAAHIVSSHYPEHEIACLLSIRSKNKDSYMFHTPNISLTELQAEAMDLPLLTQETSGEKEKELEDLKDLISNAKKQYNIEGIVTGAIESVYQASRVQRICLELGLWCFNPLWQKSPQEVLEDLVKNKFEVILSAVAAYPLDEKWLGRKIDMATIKDLLKLQKEYGIQIAGEGGEYESLVLHCPLFKKRLEVVRAHTHYGNHAGQYVIEEARLV